MKSLQICQSCGKEILLGEESVEVKIGVMHKTGHPHYVVYPKRKDFFHKNCDISIAQLEVRS